MEIGKPDCLSQNVILLTKSDIWKLSFISTVTLTVHTISGPKTELFENRRNLKTTALGFRVDGKILKTELFENFDLTLIM